MPIVFNKKHFKNSALNMEANGGKQHVSPPEQLRPPTPPADDTTPCWSIQVDDNGPDGAALVQRF